MNGHAMPSYATPMQILDAYQALTPAERSFLDEAARQAIVGTRFSDPLDLIRETLLRCANGQYRWAIGDPAAGPDPIFKSSPQA